MVQKDKSHIFATIDPGIALFHPKVGHNSAFKLPHRSYAVDQKINPGENHEIDIVNHCINERVAGTCRASK
jgi:hypothetical protein